jgi:hypothetical protein
MARTVGHGNPFAPSAVALKFRFTNICMTQPARSSARHPNLGIESPEPVA